MITIIDTYSQIGGLFDGRTFNLGKWESYINALYENSAHLFKDEVDEYLASGKYTFERDFLPVIDDVRGNPKLEMLHDSFLTATDRLNERILQRFGREIDADVVLYLGLCNGAGWVTNINGRNAVLLGIEKIIELNWHDLASMHALIDHELGHIYHAQYGNLNQESGDSGRNFVWQLFSEGIAMRFEQMLADDDDYFHQGADWAKWCGDHFREILRDFDMDHRTMTRFDQRYFGDWVRYCGYGDVGYYLGARFVRALAEDRKWDDLIGLNIDFVYALYEAFVRENR